MTISHPRSSTSDALLNVALDHAKTMLNLETQCIRLRDLSFHGCEGFYSKAAQACPWPCSITQPDLADQLNRVSEAIVHWADVIRVSTPIRWGNASSLYFKMVERMNCIQAATGDTRRRYDNADGERTGTEHPLACGGRKAHKLDSEPMG